MKRLIALFATLACMIGLATAPAPPAVAGSVPVFGDGWKITLTFPDMQWTDHVCQYGNATVQVESSQWIEEWYFYGEITYQPDGRGFGSAYGWGERTGTFTVRDAVYICPDKNPNGLYEVRGEVGVYVPGDEYVGDNRPFSTTFTLSAMTTTTTLDAPTVIGSQTTFSGHVLAQSAVRGAIGADRSAQVAIEALTGTTWTRIGLGSLDATGYFAIPVPVVLTPGTQFRANYPGTVTSGASISAPRVVPAPPLPSPTVKLKAVSGRSKIKVDVNPNMGRKYWTFQVQRKNSNGSWTALKTYKTQGTKETRTVNLKKGTYKVWVNPKFGYQGVMSTNEVKLRK